MNEQIMSKDELIERGFTTDKNGRVLDDSGNEYRNENGQCMYIEDNKCDEDKAYKMVDIGDNILEKIYYCYNRWKHNR